MCQHQPLCPPADASDREAAHVAASHPGQGWSLLCNGVVMFEDTGASHRQRSAPRYTSGSPEATKKAR